MNEIVERVTEALMDQERERGRAMPYFQAKALAVAAIKAIRELPEKPGRRYAAGEYSRRTQTAMVDDALGIIE